MCSSVGILHLQPFIWGMYLSSCWSSFELLGSVFSCTICSWSQPLPFRWQPLLDTEAWWMWSRNLGAICAHSVAGALTSKLSVSNDPLETSWKCNFHYPLSFSVQCDGYIFCAALSLVSFNVVSDNALLTKMVPRQWIDASSSWKCRKDLFWFSVVKKRVNVLLKHCLFITIRHYVFNWCPWHSLCFSCIQIPNQELPTFMHICIGILYHNPVLNLLRLEFVSVSI